MGPSVFLYLPMWFFGVLCFKITQKHSVSVLVAIVLFLFSIIGIVVFSIGYVQSFVDAYMTVLLPPDFYVLLLEPAERFASDYILALFVALNIFSFTNIGRSIFIFKPSIGFAIQKMATHTFSLYLYHMPLLFFISAIVPYKPTSVVTLILCWVVVPFLIFYLSNYTENKKYKYKLFFNRMLNVLKL
ncbi:hypothetical protein [Paraglaciecola arctica]|uniref:hypothetical protein n=1 Tax=Paraglaciecola arctica TaxID=1128911 RepID=UPI0002D69DA4|nr:hypothetical protein [Paraglaciecola arctica]